MGLFKKDRKESAASAASAPMFCGGCGGPTPPGTKFCGACGRPVSSSPQQVAAAATPPATPVAAPPLPASPPAIPPPFVAPPGPPAGPAPVAYPPSSPAGPGNQTMMWGDSPVPLASTPGVAAPASGSPTPFPAQFPGSVESVTPPAAAPQPVAPPKPVYQPLTSVEPVAPAPVADPVVELTSAPPVAPAERDPAPIKDDEPDVSLWATVMEEPEEPVKVLLDATLERHDGTLVDIRLTETDNRFVVGRSKSVTGISTDDVRASREHFEIFMNETTPVLRDLDSSNGTFLNGQRVTADSVLKNGDVIEFGRSRLVFRSGN